MTPAKRLHIGRNRLSGRPLSLEWDEFADHALMFGMTGMGKSTLLEHWMRQYVQAGYGFALLDPEGTLFRRALTFLYKMQIRPERIRIVDLTEDTFCTRLNYFDLEGLNHEERAAIVLEAMLKYSQDDGQYRPLIETFGDASLRALAKSGKSLALLYEFLANEKVRAAVLAAANDRFSTKEWQRWGEQPPRDQGFQIGGIQRRSAIIESREKIRCIVSAQENAINWRQAMDKGQIVLANLQHPSSRVSRLVGILLVDQLKRAALCRPEGLRDFFFIVDEFAQFTSDDFLDALKRFRKRNVHVVLAAQDLADLMTEEGDRLLQSAKNNTSLQVVFHMNNPKYCRELAAQLFPLQITGKSIKYQGQHQVFRPIPTQEEVTSETEAYGETSPGASHSSSETARGNLYDVDEEDVIRTSAESSSDPSSMYSHSLTRTMQWHTEYETLIQPETPVFNTPDEEEIHYAQQLYAQDVGECFVRYHPLKSPLPVTTPAPGAPGFPEAIAAEQNIRRYVERIYQAMGVSTFAEAEVSLSDEIDRLEATGGRLLAAPKKTMPDLDAAVPDQPQPTPQTEEELKQLRAKVSTPPAARKRRAANNKG